MKAKKIYFIITEAGTYNSVDGKRHFQYVRKMNRDYSKVVEAWVFNHQTQSWDPIEVPGW